jgi:CRISPR-associated endoribonuclease Cas6
LEKKVYNQDEGMNQLKTENNMLYSVILELTAGNSVILPATIGHKIHAAFFELLRQIDPTLNRQLHESGEVKPFTLSPLLGIKLQGNAIRLKKGQTYQLRLTLLDGGSLWQQLSKHLLENRPCGLLVGEAELMIDRVVLTSATDGTNWAETTNWQALASLPACPNITLRFASPTAFSLGKRQFGLFPEPSLVWGSLASRWNRFAPEALQIDKVALGTFIQENVMPSDCDITTHTLHFSSTSQKGFVGTCSYAISNIGYYANHLATLAAFARYSGVGSKTTMGMGQVQMKNNWC